MPELPEVETCRRGLAPHIEGQKITDVIVRERQLRWPINKNLKKILSDQRVNVIQRRGKYLLFCLDGGTLMLHLGMSGSLRMVNATESLKKHDHVDIIFGKKVLRFNDPRRFGSLHWTTQAVAKHKLLQHLGPEPLNDSFDAFYLYAKSRKRQVAVKNFIMNSQIVVGVGNIYAAESLFAAGIHPKRAAGKVSLPRYESLVIEIKKVLHAAIKQGGTTLRDFVNSDGKPGYFKQELSVYGREGLPCLVCGHELHMLRLGQRASVFCPHCQK